MSYGLIGAGGYLQGGCWLLILEVAEKHGWKPLGTLAPMFLDEDDNLVSCELDDWDGNYWTNDYQIVTEEDARGIANALELARSMLTARVLGVGGFSSEDDDLRRLWGGYIPFCRAGEFSIS